MTRIDDDLMRSWQLHLQAKQCSPRTIKVYREGFNRLRLWLEANERSCVVTTLDRNTLQAFLLDMQERYAPATQAINYKAVKQLCNWLLDEREIDTHPMARIPVPQVPETPIPVFEADAISAMLAIHSGKTFDDRRNTAILMLLADSGLRCEECATIQLANLDIIAGTVLVKGKGGKWRTVTFGQQTAVALDRYLRARKAHRWSERSDRLWLGARGPLGTNGVAGLVRATCQRVGIPGGHTHLFRHTWASAMKEAGVQPDELKALAGWSSDAMLQKYGRATLDRRAIATGRRHSTMDRLHRKA